MLKNYSSSNNNKQNISTNRSYMSSNKNHPSYQSISHEYKPTIRVGYSVTKINPPNNKTNKSTHNSNKNMLMNQIVTKTCKKMFQPTATTKNTNIQNQHKKRLATSRQLKSGKFIQGEYIKQTNKKSVQYHKKNVQESHDRYQSGHNVKQNIQNQFKNSRQRRSSRCYSTSSLHNSKVSQKVLPSYQNVGIKDIMQYQHAGKYRDTAITDKCTKSSAISRFLKYQQLNDYDFRKKPQFLRS